jgi:hypothetical protein
MQGQLQRDLEGRPGRAVAAAAGRENLGIRPGGSQPDPLVRQERRFVFGCRDPNPADHVHARRGDPVAEGASLQREGLVFKAEDRISRVSGPWGEVLSLMLRFAGDAERAALDKIHLLWAPVERFSVSERANAIAQTTGVISRRQQLIEIWGMSPDQANRNLSEATRRYISPFFSRFSQPRRVIGFPRRSKYSGGSSSSSK